MSSNKISLSINGQPVSVPSATTIMEAALQAGIEIPHLCHLPSKADAKRPCLLCLVEADGKQVRSCRTPVHEGMVVETASPALKNTGLNGFSSLPLSIMVIARPLAISPAPAGSMCRAMSTSSVKGSMRPRCG